LPQREYRTRYRTRYVRFSFAASAHSDLFDGIRQIVGMVVSVGVEKNFERHPKIAGCLPWIRTPLHQPGRRCVSQSMRGFDLPLL